MFIVPLVLASASLLASPGDPPVYGPCAPKNPYTQYDHPLLDPWADYSEECKRKFDVRFAVAVAAYYVQVYEVCPAGDCACYEAAWRAFLDAMEDAEISLIFCGITE